MKDATMVEFPINTCRLCTEIKNDVVEVVQDTVLNMSIWMLLSIKITKNDELPITVCKCCCDTIYMWKVFKENTLKNNKKLQKLLQEKIVYLDQEYITLISERVETNVSFNRNTTDNCVEIGNEEVTLQNNMNTDLIIIPDISSEFSNERVIKDEPMDENEQVSSTLPSVNSNHMVTQYDSYGDNTIVEPSEEMNIGNCEVCIKEEIINEYEAENDCNAEDDSQGDNKSEEINVGIDESYINEEIINEDMAEDDEYIMDVLCNDIKYETVSAQALDVLENNTEVSSETFQTKVIEIHMEQCSACPKVFSNPNELQEHLTTHMVNTESNKVPRSDNLIDKYTSESNNLETNESMEITYIGSKQKLFSNPLKKTNPLKDMEPDEIHSNIQPQYMCPLCTEKFFMSLEKLDEHMKAYHSAISQTSSSNSGLDFNSELEFEFQKVVGEDVRNQALTSEKDGWSCCICQRRHATETKLLVHMNIHCTGKYKFVCHLCGYKYKSNCSDRHFLQLHCPLCNETTSTRKSGHLEQHIQEYLEWDSEFVCSQCGLKLTTNEELEKHIASWHTYGNCYYKCEECGKDIWFPNNLQQQRHIQIHEITTAFVSNTDKGRFLPSESTSEIYNWTCKLCGKRFKDEDHIMKHSRMSHCEANQFLCHLCGIKFKHMPNDKPKHLLYQHCPICNELLELKTKNWATAGRLHMKQKHSSEGKHFCSQCGLGIDSCETNHMNSYHSDGKYYDCRKCNKRIQFCTIIQYQRHLMIHKLQSSPSSTSQSKILTCSQCGRDLHSEYEMKIHKDTIHSNGKIYNCPECSRDIPFTKKEFFLDHMNTEIELIIKKSQTAREESPTDNELNNEEAIETWICASLLCNIVFKTGEDLFDHVVKNHTTLYHDYVYSQLIGIKRKKPSTCTTCTYEPCHTCTICKKKFGNCKSLVRHMRTHSTKLQTAQPHRNSLKPADKEPTHEPVICPVIGMKSDKTTRHSVIQRDKPASDYDIESDTPDTDCDDQRDESASDYDIQRDKPAKKRFSCPLCHKIFGHRGNLKQHVAAHSTAVQTTRPYCNTTLTPADINPTPGQVNCPICNEDIRHKNRLNQHLATHANLYATNECHVCGTNFQNIHNLKFHITNHHTRQDRLRHQQVKKILQLQRK